MQKFRALIKGTNLMAYNADLQRVIPSGFYVTAFVEADSRDAAEESALSLVRQSHVHTAATNSSTNPPRIAVKELTPITEWPAGTHRPLTGFALYDEQSTADEHASI